MTNTNKMRDVYVAVADPTRRELISLLADVEELPLHFRLNLIQASLPSGSWKMIQG